MSKMQAVGLGWDIGRPGGDKTVYFCRTHGHDAAPCECIKAYFKSQVREAERRRRAEFAERESILRAELRRERKT